MEAKRGQRAVVAGLGMAAAAVAVAVAIQNRERIERSLFPTPLTEWAVCTLRASITGPPIDAHVLELRGERGAILDAGLDRGVGVGYEFTIYRDDRFVGKVRVLEVWSDRCRAEILFTSEGVSMLVGDSAATQL